MGRRRNSWTTGQGGPIFFVWMWDFFWGGGGNFIETIENKKQEKRKFPTNWSTWTCWKNTNNGKVSERSWHEIHHFTTFLIFLMGDFGGVSTWRSHKMFYWLQLYFPVMDEYHLETGNQLIWNFGKFFISSEWKWKFLDFWCWSQRISDIPWNVK